MAYYFGAEDEDNNNNETFQASKQSSVIANGPAGGSAPAGAPANTASTNNARSNPGNFVGISQYLDANKPQSAKLAGQVGNVITGAADTARNEFGTKVQDTSNQIKANTVGYDQSVVDQLNRDASKADVARIEAMKNASYKGPNSLGNIDSLAAAKQANANADSEEGRKQLVGSLYKDQPLKKGALTFDNLLLQADPEAKSALAAAKSKADVGGLESNIASEKARLEAAAQAAKATTAKTAANTQSAITQAQSGFESGLQKRVDDARKSAISDSQNALNALRSGGGLTGIASDKDLQLLGINRDQFDSLVRSGTANQGADAAQIRDAAGAINAGNVASAEDYARYNVLKRLAGGGNFLGDDASQAGKYNSDLLDFNFVEPTIQAPAPAVQPAPQGGIEINAPGENDPKKGSILRAPDGTPILDNGEPMVTGGPPPEGTAGKNGSLDKVDIGVTKALKKIKWR